MGHGLTVLRFGQRREPESGGCSGSGVQQQAMQLVHGRDALTAAVGAEAAGGRKFFITPTVSERAAADVLVPAEVASLGSRGAEKCSVATRSRSSSHWEAIGWRSWAESGHRLRKWSLPPSNTAESITESNT